MFDKLGYLGRTEQVRQELHSEIETVIALFS